MTLLILTQAVNIDDPVLGFFHRWLEEFAKHFERIEVICLYEGRHALPENVSVHSLGKEKGPSRLKYVFRFYRYIFSLHYDAVFSHMNEEYILLGGPIWRLLGKKVVLERNFRTGSWMTPIAARIANVVDYTSPDSFTARFSNAVQTPVGIDTNFFSPAETLPAPGSILFLGRTDSVKRVDVFLEAMQLLANEGVEGRADIYGDPTPGNEAYAEALKKKYAEASNVSFYPGVPNTQTPELYRSHAMYVNITPSGSFDKTIGEAMACGAVVVCANGAVRDVLPENLMAGDTAETTAEAIRAALAMSAAERAELAEKSREWVLRKHSLKLLGQWLADTFSA